MVKLGIPLRISRENVKILWSLGQFASLAGNKAASISRGELINIGDMKRNFLVHDAGMNINVFNFEEASWQT